MTPERLAIEESLLKKYFPNRYHFQNLFLPDEFLDFGWRTQKRNVYRINIRLKPDYPNSLPEVYIVFPLPLKKKDGSTMACVSHKMHTLTNDGEKVQICHFKREKWGPHQSLFKIILKVRIWLECYERHLDTGDDIDDFLNKIN